MKKFRIIIALTLVLAMLFGFTASATVISSANSVVNNDKYEYPITPQKTPEIWRSFSTHQEMLEACEIPKDTLEAMSTKSLLLACLEYPLAGDALCYDNVYAGFESVMNNSNALTELFSRSDFSDALASLFETTTAVNLKNNTTGFECITQFISLITAHSVKNELISQNDEKRIIDNIDAFVKGLSNDNLSASIRSIMAADNYNSKASYITLNGNRNFIAAKKYHSTIKFSFIKGEKKHLEV